MNVIRACCLRYLKENKKRTIVTILGVVLATGLITATACMLMSAYVGLLDNLKRTYGDAHVIYEDVKGGNLKYFEQNQNFESIGYSSFLGFADIPETNEGRVYLDFRAADADWYRRSGVQLISGRMPEKEDELIVGRDSRTVLGLDYKVGDQIRLRIGQRAVGDQVLAMRDDYQEEEVILAEQEKTYTIVGFFQGGHGSLWNDNGRIIDRICAYTYLDMAGAEESKLYDIYARYTQWGMRHYEQVNGGLSAVSGGIDVKDFLINFECIDPMDKDFWSMAALFLAVFLIMLLAGIFGIINSFDISLTEKIRFYGMMSSVGTTRKQRRQLVWTEAFHIGSAGILGGLMLGIVFAYGLVKFVNTMLSRRMGYALTFRISWPAILVAVFFSALMVFLSAVEAADRAAKISPIEAIRSNDTVKNPGKPRRTPKYVQRVFGIGGCIAYQNFQRAKVKYRTIVITIVVSVSLFVGTSVIRYVFDNVEETMGNNYKYHLEIWTRDPDGFEKLKSFAKQPGVLQAEIVRTHPVRVEAGGVFRPDGGVASDLPMQGQEFHVYICVMDEESFQAYCGQVGVSYEETKGKAIVNAQKVRVEKEVGKVVKTVETIAEFQAGDVVSGQADLECLPVSVEVACQTQELPLSQSEPLGIVMCFVDESWERNQPGIMDRERPIGTGLYVCCEDAYAMEDAIIDSDLMDYGIMNYVEEYQDWKNIRLVFTVFPVGVIGVIILIGVTNVFNALTTNMELRAPEFARLRAVGMTEKEFRNMIWMEGLFYGGKALLIGLPVGVIISYGLSWLFVPGLDATMTPYEYQFPIPEILISIVAIAILLYVIMLYCMKKIGRRNVIETIRNENI